MRILGHQVMNVAASGTAAVPPVDMTIVLDQSESLVIAGAWSDLQTAAKSFVSNFSETIDKVGLVSYNTRATEWTPLQHDFISPINQAVNTLVSTGYTNPGEGLRLGRVQLSGPAVRPSATKIVVFFTDGRPTAFRGTIGGQDRIMTVYQTNQGVVRGYYNNPDLLAQNAPPPAPNVHGCSNWSWCSGWRENSSRNQARSLGLQEADALRSAGVLIISIGLGDPTQSNPLWQPDLNYLRDIANEGGRIDANQPQGKMYFAPSAAQLQAVFDQVAQDLLVRLAS